MQRPEDLPLLSEGHGHGRFVDRNRRFDLRQSEIEQLHAGFGDENVGGFQIAMNHARAVRNVQRVADLYRVFEGPVERQRSLQRRAVHVLHDEVVGSNVVERADVGMIQRRDGPSLALEPLREGFLRHLDRDDAVEASVTSFVDVAHAAAPKRSYDFIRAEASSVHERHGLRVNISSTGAGAPPPARTDADASPRIPWSSARHGRGRSCRRSQAEPRFHTGRGEFRSRAAWSRGRLCHGKHASRRAFLRTSETVALEHK